MATKITNHYFEYLSLKYFRGNAHLVEIGTFGEKKDPVGTEAYLDPSGKVSRDHLMNRISKGIMVSIDWSQTNQADVEANGTIKAYGLNVNVAATYSFSKTKSANLKLYNLYILDNPLMKMLNQDAKAAREFLAAEGSDGRIVSECWIVMEAELAEHFEGSGTFTTSVPSVGNLNITATGGKHGTQTITLSAGSVFAYKNHKVKSWNSGKTVIENMEADYYGNG
jgi:hypothetical protein